MTSATIMANGERFEEAAAAARQSPTLGIGCHVVLVDGTPVGDAHEVPSLLDRKHRDRFRHSLSAFALNAASSQVDPRQVELEITAQLRKLQAAGLAVSHVDTHKHTHMLPAILKPLLRAASACGIRAVRNPFVPRRAVSLAVLRHRPDVLKRYFQVRLLRAAFARRFTHAVTEAGFITPHGSFGVIETGYLDQYLLEAIIDAIPEGTWELVCHPGYLDDELAAANTRLRQSRVRELETLTSPAIRDRLSQRGIELISYRDLAAAPPKSLQVNDLPVPNRTVPST